MRLIGHLSTQPAALLFSQYLRLQGITHELERERDGWGVWVHSEDELGRARDLLAGYVTNPQDPRFTLRARGARAEAVELGEATEPDRVPSPSVSAGSTAAVRPSFGVGPLTLAMVLVCAAVGLLSEFGEVVDRLGPLFICPFEVDGLYIKWEAGLSQIFSGEVWRLVTPVFVHFGFIHLLVNMLWLVYLGSMIEYRERTLRLAGLVVVIATLSNLGQYALGGPSFGGMSGVVYGLLGYIWMKGRFQPGSGYFLDLRTVTFMLIWLFVCLAGIIPDVANGAHVFGLLAGLAWGFVSAKHHAWKIARA